MEFLLAILILPLIVYVGFAFIGGILWFLSPIADIIFTIIELFLSFSSRVKKLFSQ